MSQHPRGTWTPAQRWALAAMAIANFAVALDFLGVNVALPAIGRDLDGSTGALQWVTTAYLFTLTTALVPAGRAADLFGRPRTCMVGLVGFASGSVASAVAGSVDMLVVARGATGVGAAILTATTLAIVSDAFPEQRSRGVAIGVWTAIGAVGSALGPPLAGIVTEAASWRWFLVLAVPLTAVALVFVARGGAAGAESDRAVDAPAEPASMDWPGAVLLVAGGGAIVVALLEGPNLGWSAPEVVTGVVVALAASALFVLRERATPAPLLELSRFRDRRFAAGTGVAFLANVGFACVLFFMTLYLQQVRGLSPSEAGLVFLALSVALIVGSPVAGRLVGRVGGGAVMAAGMLMVTVSFVVLGLVGVGTGLAFVAVGLALSGFGQAFAFDASNTVALDAVDDEDAGAAAGLVSGVRQAGSLLGLAVAGTVFRLLERVPDGGAPTPAAFLDALAPTMLGIAACCAVGIWVARLGGQRAAPRPTGP